MCSAALDAFGDARTLSAPIQHAMSEKAGCQTSEPLDSVIGGMLANQRGVWEGRNTVCALVSSAALQSWVYIVTPIVSPRVSNWRKQCLFVFWFCSGRSNLY